MMEMRKKRRPAPPAGCWLQSVWDKVVFLEAGEVDVKSFGRRRLQRRKWREANGPSEDMEGLGVVEACSVGQSFTLERLMGQAAWYAPQRAIWS